MRPLLGADRVTVQRVDHGITALLLFLIAGRQKDDYVAIDGIAFEIALKRRAVNLDVLYRDRLCARDNLRDVRFHLGIGLRGRCHRNRHHARKQQLHHSHLNPLSKHPACCTG